MERDEMKTKPLIRYSESFKLQVLRELEEGKFPSRAAAERAYGIGGQSTIEKWIRKYGLTHLQRKVVRVQTPKEVDELKELRREVRKLKEALADSHLDNRMGEAYLQIACRMAGIEDLDDFKKKHAGKW